MPLLEIAEQKARSLGHTTPGLSASVWTSFMREKNSCYLNHCYLVVVGFFFKSSPENFFFHSF